MDNDKYKDALTYKADKPSMSALKQCFDETIAELEHYFHQARVSYDERRCYWAGKSTDLRKHGADAFPWEGASDTEVPLIAEKINTYVELMMNALGQSTINAYPTSVATVPRAKLVSLFLKYMKNSYIRDFKQQMELGANYLLEKDLMITYVGWEKQLRSFLRDVTLEEIFEESPEIAGAITDGNNDDAVAELFISVYPNLSKIRAKAAIRDIRNKGQAQIPLSQLKVNRPIVQSLAADAEIFYPSWCIDPQRAPFVHWKTFLTPQEIENKVETEGWDRKWADYVIDHYRGIDGFELESQYASNTGGRSAIDRFTMNENDLIAVVYTYQRLIDKEDGAEGIYCTVWHPQFTGNDQSQGYAKHDLLNGYDDYPFVVTRLRHDHRRMYDVQTIPELLRGAQYQIKAERDSRIDRSSLATLPPILHPIGRPPEDWGPGRKVPYTRKDEFDYGPTPPQDSGSLEIEQTLLKQANALIGLDEESGLSSIRQNFYITKFLTHVKDVLIMAYKCFQRFGPEEVFFMVTGNPDPVQFPKGSPDEDFDVMINFNSLSNDPKAVESRLSQFVQLLSLDRNAKISVDRLIEILAPSIDPSLADAVLQPSGEQSQEVMKKVTEDLAKIYAGIEVGAQPNGAQIAMQAVQSYAQQPDVAQRLQADEAFRARLEKYMQQYQFQMQQAQNAEIGRSIGSQPAAFQGTNT